MTPFKGIYKVEACLICTPQGNWIISDYYERKYWDFRPDPDSEGMGEVIGYADVAPGIKITYEWRDSEKTLYLCWLECTLTGQQDIHQDEFKVAFEDGGKILLTSEDGVPLRYIVEKSFDGLGNRF